MKKKFAVTFMVSGIICICVAVAILIYNNAESKKAQQYAVTVMDSIVNVISENEQLDYEQDPFDTDMLTTEIDGYEYIGYLLIPRINMELPVMAQWDYTRLKLSPCRYYGSVKTDNLVIAAHNYRSQFGYLGNLTEGDIVMFTDMEGKTFTYEVTVVELLQPTDTGKVKDTGDDLILYTCNYRGDARITVRCCRAGNQ
ncbi:MAG: sortase [Clostridia bacterium]|nr:sortase [Clostridia bacterium]